MAQEQKQELLLQPTILSLAEAVAVADEKPTRRRKSNKGEA